MAQSTQSQEKRSPFAAVAPAFELMCWLVVLLAPFLRWFNGAPVTGDQAAIQIALVVLAVVSALALRIYNWSRQKKEGGKP